MRELNYKANIDEVVNKFKITEEALIIEDNYGNSVTLDLEAAQHLKWFLTFDA